MKAQLLKPHTHAGIPCEPNDVIDVTEPEYQWLAKQKIIVQGNKETRPLKVVPSDDKR